MRFRDTEITEEEREASYRREAAAHQPPRMGEREKATEEVLATYGQCIETLQRLHQRYRLTDCTSSAEDFQRAKHRVSDLYNLVRDQLARAEALGKPTDEVERQLTLAPHAKQGNRATR